MVEKSKAGRPSTNNFRKNEILEKASTYVIANGFTKTTLDDIGNSLAFNKAALYYYSKNKEELYTHVIKHKISNLWGKAEKETIDVDGFENKILNYFELRDELCLQMLKLNGYSKGNFISVINLFSDTTFFFRESEIAFLSPLLSRENKKQTDTVIADFLNFLLVIRTDIEMHAF